ncbi:glycosyltransferase family 2 protein [Fluviispira sanaruensis]|uniref:Glycosyltransferase family 2 protein n=1 Tax=Fluviispira sanaruensis TaxID=2493639 RepID=A0A4P2VM42_FLUSA|nr:glycosyltransferase family 2 protein [Fluviispira sanaruensis]BBH54443.1 glycosyltransferase family 2 protein [Fluviispira sanaruensis]
MEVKEIYEQYQKSQNYDISTFVPEPEKLTAIVITKNEEKNIARCLSSLDFVDEIIIVDSGSTDKTIEIAKKFSKVCVIQTKWYGFVENKRIAVEKAEHDWILWVDADEVVPVDLAKEWDERVAEGTFHETAGIDVARKTFFLNHWVKHSGWYPGRVTRFFHKKRAYFNDNILHEGVVAKQGYIVESFKTDLLHYSYTSIYQYFDKMNKYGFAGANEIKRKRKIVFLPQLFLQPMWTFFRFYFLKKGFLDGRIGLIVCIGASFSNFIKYANYFFLKKYNYVEINEKE